MLSYGTYKIIHMVGLALLFFGLGSMLGKARFLAFLSHGLGLLLLVVGGFGMAARLGLVHSLPGWIYAKLFIWLLFGLSISLMKRRPQWANKSVVLFVGLVALAAWLANTKPF